MKEMMFKCDLCDFRNEDDNKFKGIKRVDERELGFIRSRSYLVGLDETDTHMCKSCFFGLKELFTEEAKWDD